VDRYLMEGLTSYDRTIKLFSTRTRRAWQPQ